MPNKALNKWSDDNLVGEVEERLSPSGEFKLIVSYHREGSSPWPYTKAKLYKKEVLMQTLYRNYSLFWQHWMEHQNGKKYLWCGQDYHGYTCVDLERNDIKNYIPSEALKYGGFIWSRVIPNAAGTILAVSGCNWGCPEVIKFYDFSNPDEWPLKEIGGLNFDADKYIWEGNVFYAYQERFFRKSDNLDIEHAWDYGQKDENGNIIISDDEYNRLCEDACTKGKEAECRLVFKHRWEPPMIAPDRNI